MNIQRIDKSNVSFQRRVPTEDFLKVLLYSKGYKTPSIDLAFQSVSGRTIPEQEIENAIKGFVAKLSGYSTFFKKIEANLESFFHLRNGHKNPFSNNRQKAGNWMDRQIERIGDKINIPNKIKA